MARIKFVKLLLLAVLGSVLLFYITTTIIPIALYLDLTLISITFFSVLSCVTFLLGEKALLDKNGNAYVRVVVLNIIAKMFGSFVFVLIYAKLTQPEDKLFLFPFLTTYLVFLFFETYFLNNQSRGGS